jgi:Tfp pilus assembly protein FimV
MKKITLWILTFVFTATLLPAQDAATQQQLDKLSGQIQDVQDALAQQDKRIAALEQEVAALRDKVNAPVVTDYASRDDLKKLAEDVQEIDRKRQDDRDLILKQIEKLGKVAAVPPPSPTRQIASTPRLAEETGAADTPHYEYEIKPGDTLGLIVKAYREQGVKVTKSQIIAANPKMNPNILIPGRKIIIPAPAAK